MDEELREDDFPFGGPEGIEEPSLEELWARWAQFFATDMTGWDVLLEKNIAGDSFTLTGIVERQVLIPGFQLPGFVFEPAALLYLADVRCVPQEALLLKQGEPCDSVVIFISSATDQAPVVDSENARIYETLILGSDLDLCWVGSIAFGTIDKPLAEL